MDFIFWHYCHALGLYLRQSFIQLKKVNHFFSFPSLIVTLFKPWKRMSQDHTLGFDVQKFFETISFNLISVSIGFVVRIFLIIFCLVTFLFVILYRFVGFILNILVPFISIFSYLKYKKLESSQISYLLDQIKNHPPNTGKIIFKSEAGKFILNHLNLPSQVVNFLESLNYTIDNSIISPTSFESFFKNLLSQNKDSERFWATYNLSSQDIILSARWWDLFSLSQSKPSETIDLGRPGIGVNLTYGYSVNLDRYSEDLGLANVYHHRLIGRNNLVTRIKTVLESGRNVILTGEPGVGRMTVVFEFTHNLLTGQLGSYFNAKRVIKLDYQSVLAEGDVEGKRTAIKNLLIEAKNAGNIIMVIKEFQRLTNPSVSGYDFTDIISDVISDSNIPIIALCNTQDYQRYISHDSRISKHFDAIEVTPPSKEEAMDILLITASDNEQRYGITFTTTCLRQLLEGSDRYISDIPFPEKVLELLSEITIQKSNSSSRIVTLEDAINLISEKTKIPMVRITESEKSKLSSIEEIIHQKLIGQDAAVNLIGKSLRSRSAGLKNEERPIGSFLFLGPTGVGKTETAKVLSQVYFGDNQPILRYDMAEYIGPEGVARLIGSISQNQVGNLTSAIKNAPSSLLLFDEIEKAPPEIFNLFLTLLDEGYLTDVFNQKIKCSNLFIIATSNAAAEYIRQQVNRGIVGEELQKLVVEYIQQNRIFTAEFLNRFDGIVVFEPLTNNDLLAVTKLMLKKLQENLKLKNIFLNYDSEVVQKIVSDNYQPSLGARPIRRAIDLVLSDIISKPILKNEIKSGDKINITAGLAKDEYYVNIIS